MSFVTRVGLLIVIAIIQLLAPAVAATPDQPITVEAKVYTGPLEPRAQKAPEQLRGDANHALGNRLIRLQTLSANAARAMTAQDPVGPTKIGFGRDVPSLKAQQDTTTQLDWKPTTGGMIGSLAINSNGAAALRVGIRIQSIPDSAEVRFFSDNATEVQLVSGKTIMGLIKQNLDAGDPEEAARVYWSPVIQGEIAGVEIFIPDGVKTDEVQISIPQVSHLTVSPQSGVINPKDIGSSASCEFDVACSGYSGGDTSVARLLYTKAGVSRYCTGTLTTDGISTIPYLLTANHCISDQSSATSLISYWNFVAASCGSTAPSNKASIKDDGALLLSTTIPSDSTLLRLNGDAPPMTGIRYWQKTKPYLSYTAVTFHNPQGDLQKYSGGSIAGFANCPASNGSITCTPSDSDNSTHILVRFRQGITESGSSGAAVLTDGSAIIGQLSGGSATCQDPSGLVAFGRFDKAFYDGGYAKWLEVPDSRPIKIYLYGLGVVSNAGGRVISEPFGLDCGSTLKICEYAFEKNATVTLKAIPDSGYRFREWGGDAPPLCQSTTSDKCTVVVSAVNRNDFTAVFESVFTISALNTGNGTITSYPAGINCGSTCSASFNSGTGVNLTATPNSGYTFSGWSGACSGTRGCNVMMNSNQSVSASFSVAAPTNYSLGITNPGNGTITSNPIGINCGSTCSASFNSGTSVTLTATPNSGYTFSGWSGACSGTGACTVTMNSNQSVSANFSSAAPTTYLLSIFNAGNGNITSNPAGINCGSTCSASFNSGTSVTLTATPNSGYTFSGWSGACSGTGACTVTMNTAQSVSANFSSAAPSTYLLSILSAFNGNVTSSPAGINCGLTCNYSFPAGTGVLLTATPNAGYTFIGWSGACTGTGDCLLTMNSIQSVSATFSQSLPSTYLISVINSGNGTVSSNSGKIDCGFVCSASYSSGETEVLLANPSPGYTFTGWSGACSGTGSCILTVSSNQSVTANFVAQTPTGKTLTVVVPTDGSLSPPGGTIVSNPSGINCNQSGKPSCSAQFPLGTQVVLTATPDSGSHIQFWDNACVGVAKGASACTVIMNADKTASVGFVNKYFIQIPLGFMGGGYKLSPSPAAYDPFGQLYGYIPGTVVTVTPDPQPGYAFSAWGGSGCSGSGACQLTMNADYNLTITYSKLPTLTVTKLGNGKVSSSPSGIDCGSACSANFNSGTSVSLSATPDTGYTFAGWSGACSGTGACVLTLNSNQSVSANFSAVVVPTTYSLGVTKVGNGTVTANPSGINCGPTCSFAYTQGASVSLTAAPDSGYAFSGWSGACSGSGACTVSMSAAQSVTATFTALPNVFSKLTVTRPTLGVIASDAAKINCGIKAAACSNSLQQGTVITLTAAPKAGYYTKGWSGCTSSTGDSCVLTIGGAPMVVSASFAPIPKFTLKVTKNKLGTVTSDPAAINCKANVTSCSSKIFSGTKVTLTATPIAGRTFVGWTGACSGKDACSLTMDGSKGLSANFQ